MTLDSPRTLAGRLRQRAAELPQHVVYRYLNDGETETDNLTYAALDEQARAIAARLLALGAPGQPVLLLYGPGLQALAALFGCLYAGMIAAPLSLPRLGPAGGGTSGRDPTGRNPTGRSQPLTALAAVAADARAASVLTTQDWLARAWPQVEQTPSLRQLHWLATDAPAALDDPAAVWRETQPDDLAVLLYTSGSTSAPKGVLLSHHAMQGPPLPAPPGWDPDDAVTAVSWTPLYHVAGLNNLLIGLKAPKATVVVLPPEAVLADPLCWLRAIAHYRALHARAPNFLYQMCVDQVAPEDRAGLDLSAWFCARCSAEPIRAETVEQFTAAYAPYGFRPEAFQPGYGLSEHHMVSGTQPSRLPLVRTFDRAALAENRVVSALDHTAPGVLRLVGNGAPGQGVVVRIVDPGTGQPCPAGAVGEVWVASEWAAAGYWDKPEATAAAFQARLAGSGEGPFLRTGDLGFLYEGELFICGRLKDVIIVRGHNYYAEDVEAAAAGSHPDLGRAAAAFAAPIDAAEHLVIYHEVRPDCAAPDVQAISAAIRGAVAREMQLPVYAVVLVQAGALPRTPVGKIRRFVCRDEFMAGLLDA